MKKSKFLDAYFASDLHLGHSNILKFSRPEFETIEEHDEYLIKVWNETVKPEDKVFILGDFAFNSRYDYLARLNGNITLVLGNHDYPSKIPLIQKYRPDIKLAGAIIEGPFAITHVPVHPSQLEYRAKVNIHGHLHNYKIDDPRYINVSMEQLKDYKPQKLRSLLDESGIRL